jgi:putative flippase GtrA
MLDDLRSGTAPSEAGRFGLFLVAGGIAAAANYGSRFAFSVWFSYPTAIVLAYLVGMIVAFALMRRYVFDGVAKALAPQVLKFTLVNALAVVQTLVVSLLLARWALPALGIESHVEAIAHAFGVAVPIVTSYFGHKHATFR